MIDYLGEYIANIVALLYCGSIAMTSLLEVAFVTSPFVATKEGIGGANETIGAKEIGVVHGFYNA